MKFAPFHSSIKPSTVKPSCVCVTQQTFFFFAKCFSSNPNFLFKQTFCTFAEPLRANHHNSPVQE